MTKPNPAGNLNYLSPGMSIVNSAEKNELRVDKTSEPIDLNPPAPIDEGLERDVNLKNIKSYLKAEASYQLTGPVPDETYERRLAICMGCDKRKNSKARPDRVGYCSACGCGVSKRSALSVKLKMPESACPLELWKPAKGTRGGIRAKLKSYLLDKLLK